MLRRYLVRTGDTLDKIARRHGCDPQSIRAEPSNQELWKRGRDADLLAPGDVILLPEPTVASARIAPGGTHQYVAAKASVHVRVAFLDGATPLAGVSCRISGLKDEPVEVPTDDAGVLSFEAPVAVEHVTVTLPNQVVGYRISIGTLDPVETLSGVRQRLANLGFLSGPDDGDLEVAVHAFQRAASLAESGILDDATQKALLASHGR